MLLCYENKLLQTQFVSSQRLSVRRVSPSIDACLIFCVVRGCTFALQELPSTKFWLAEPQNTGSFSLPDQWILAFHWFRVPSVFASRWKTTWGLVRALWNDRRHRRRNNESNCRFADWVVHLEKSVTIGIYPKFPITWQKNARTKTYMLGWREKHAVIMKKQDGNIVTML